MTLKARGGWTEKILYGFEYNGKDGFSPDAVIFDTSGNLYGTAYYGGNGNCMNAGQGGCGTVFEIKLSVGAPTRDWAAQQRRFLVAFAPRNDKKG
jgi:hypothetical protein